MSVVSQFIIPKEEVKPEIDIKQEEPIVCSFFEKCRYCNCSREKDDMMLVPAEPLLSRWVEKLGLEFYNNLKKNSTNYICWSHFNLPYRLKSHYMRFLPNLPKKKLSIVNEKEKDRDKKEKPLWYRKEKGAECRYCGARCDRKDMTRVTENKKKLLKWVEILGQRFQKNVEKHKENLICWSHFKCREKWRSVWNLPMADIRMNKELADKEVKIEEMENEQKPDLELLIEKIKTEEEGKNSTVFLPDLEEENKPQFRIK